MNACHRGCRLYSICQFVNGNAGFNSSREECQGGESDRLSEFGEGRNLDRFSKIEG